MIIWKASQQRLFILLDNHLTFWIPGLRPSKQFVSELNKVSRKELPDLTNLNLILSRSDSVAASDVIEHDFILHQLNDNSEQNNNWPLAQWRLALEELSITPGNHNWLCADPVYIHPDRDQALLFAHEELEIDLEEAKQLAELINQHYHDDPWELHIGSTHRWYIKLHQPYDIETHVLHSVKGKNIFDYLPVGGDARYWQQCMNELQMLLHGSEINQKREERGLMPINSLWFWGHGQNINERHDDVSLHWQKIYSDDAVLNGLGILSGSQIAALPDEIDDIKRIDGDVLVVNQQLQIASQQHDIFDWLDELQYLEKYWFSPLIERVKQTPDLQVTLLVSDAEAYQFSARHLKRWWRFSNKNKLF